MTPIRDKAGLAELGLRHRPVRPDRRRKGAGGDGAAQRQGPFDRSTSLTALSEQSKGRLKTGEAASVPPAGLVWELPAPADGISFTVAEMSRMLTARPSTVRAWRSRGVTVRDAGPIGEAQGGPGEKRVVRLGRLSVPQGRTAPAALAAFLEATNGEANPGLRVVFTLPPLPAAQDAPAEGQTEGQKS